MKKTFFAILIILSLSSFLLSACVTKVNKSINESINQTIQIEEKNLSEEKQAEPVAPIPAQAKVCTDSDSGINFYVFGNVIDKNGQLSEDSCLGNVVHEFYCDNSTQTALFTNFQCTNEGKVCNKGACVDYNSRGSLSVTTAPEKSHLFVDTIYRGMTPMTVKVLPIGRHGIMISKAGYMTYSAAINISIGNNTLDVTLEPRNY